MDIQKIKTTVELDAQILYLAKLKALREKKTLRQLVNESLARNLGAVLPRQPGTPIKIGGHKLGGVKSDLRRTEIYEYI